MPNKILQAPGVCQMLDRTKQTTRYAMGNLATFITASGRDLEDFNLSTKTVWITRNAKRVEEYEKFYAYFQPPKHAVAVLAACRACDSIRALVFDTTSSTTGIRQGAASRLVQNLGESSCGLSVDITWQSCS